LSSATTSSTVLPHQQWRPCQTTVSKGRWVSYQHQQTDFVGATKSMRFCNDDAFIHTAPDRGFKPNVMHCFTQAQPSTTPCVRYLSRQTTASTHLLKVSIPCSNNDTLCRILLILTPTINCLCLHDTCPVRQQSQQHSVLHTIENFLNNTLCCITFW
jgi:hypothetical protein